MKAIALSAIAVRTFIVNQWGLSPTVHKTRRDNNVEDITDFGAFERRNYSFCEAGERKMFE